MLSKQQIDYFHRDQQNAIILLETVLKLLHVGQSEKDVLLLLTEKSTQLGFTGWLRTPVVHFDYRLSLRIGPSNKRILRVGSIVQIHIQPASDQAFANCGISFAFQMADLPIIKRSKELCIATSTFANHFKKAGELHIFATSWCKNNRTILNKNSIGHSCFGKADSHFLPAQWPLNMRLLTQLRRHQLQPYNPRPLRGIYAIQPDIKQDGRRVGFAELLYIDENQRIALGREHFSDICTFKWDSSS